MKRRRIKLSKPELWAALNDQVGLLIHACSSFDGGLEIIGKHIALNLRVLLHHYGNSNSLLHQLGLRKKRFLDTAGELDSRNLLTDCPLCTMHIGGGSDRYEPLCATDGGPLAPRWIPFEQWWNNSVIKDNKGRFFNRRELVFDVANTDGGAHVDPSLDEAYLELSRKNSLGWIIKSGDIERPFPPPTMACIRQIAHEVLETLKVKANGKVEVDYAI